MVQPDQSGGQRGSALCTAAGEDFAAVCSSHSLPETMDLGSVTLLGLIGTQHCVHLLKIICSTAKMLQQSGLWLREPCIDYYILKTAAVSTGFFRFWGIFTAFPGKSRGNFRQERRRRPGCRGIQRFFASGVECCCASCSSAMIRFESSRPLGVSTQRSFSTRHSSCAENCSSSCCSGWNGMR